MLVPPEEPYTLLGDFHAHMGSQSGVYNLWEGVRGPEVHGECNNFGKGLLNFLAAQEAIVCNA